MCLAASSSPLSTPLPSPQSLILTFTAAPGGWTKYLALDRGCEKVWAVDPADMELGDPLPQNIVHVRGKIQEALPVIAAELQAAGRQLDIFVTDLCPHNDTELMVSIYAYF